MYVEAYETSTKWFQTMRFISELITAVCVFYLFFFVLHGIIGLWT